MKERIDVLGPRPERARAFTGALLDDELDDELQALVERAASTLRAPIALVSLVLEKVQFFRAHYGLPADLAATRATDRDVSFCQLVVRDDQALRVDEASSDARVPQDLVERYGIASYLGVPVRANGVVLGSLCVIDLEQHPFEREDQAALEALAHDVSQRLTELSVQKSDRAARTAAMQPTFGELRNLLSAIAGGVALARMQLADIAPLGRLAQLGGQVAAAGALTRASDSLAELREVFGALEGVSTRLTEQVAALEYAIIDHKRDTQLERVLQVAQALSEHTLKLVGGASVTPLAETATLAAAPSAAATMLAAALASVANALHSAGRTGVRVTPRLDEHTAYVRIEAELDDDAWDHIADTLAGFIGGNATIRATASEQALTMAFARARPRPSS